MHMWLSVCLWFSVCGLPCHVDSHILMCGSSQDTEQLVEDGGQKIDHHMTLHGMKALRNRVILFPMNSVRYLQISCPKHSRSAQEAAEETWATLGHDA